MLQTGRAQVVNTEIDRISKSARLMFDGGSQRSYVTESLRENLRLRTVRTERLIIKTFESNMNDIEGNGFIHLELLLVPFICSPISGQCPKFVKSQYVHLRDLYLSDFVDCKGNNEMCIDVLMGADYYFSFMSGKCVRGQDVIDPVALESSVGWVLTGPYKCEQSYYHFTNNVCTAHCMKASVVPNPLNDTLKRFWEIESTGSGVENNVLKNT